MTDIRASPVGRCQGFLHSSDCPVHPCLKGLAIPSQRRSMQSADWGLPELHVMNNDSWADSGSSPACRSQLPNSCSRFQSSLFPRRLATYSVLALFMARLWGEMISQGSLHLEGCSSASCHRSSGFGISVSGYRVLPIRNCGLRGGVRGRHPLSRGARHLETFVLVSGIGCCRKSSRSPKANSTSRPLLRVTSQAGNKPQTSQTASVVDQLPLPAVGSRCVLAKTLSILFTLNRSLLSSVSGGIMLESSCAFLRRLASEDSKVSVSC